MFFDFGMDFGFVSGESGAGHFSLYPYTRFSFFLPFSEAAGWYVGAGMGFLYSSYTFPEEGRVSRWYFPADFSTGFIFRNGITVSYTYRVGRNRSWNPEGRSVGMHHKVSLGYLYRFRRGE